MTTALSTVHAARWDAVPGWRSDPEDVADDGAYADPEDLAEESHPQFGFPAE
jgi:hypothetical protein